uniref:Doublesex dimerisation domain-containing protein n=1 Tax=Lutzomyia longipalpis TaxID=7200 RepID=A0A1B0CM75_LUTLO
MGYKIQAFRNGICVLSELRQSWIFERHPRQSSEVFFDNCQKLLDKFNYPWELMPLMYVILENANVDMQEAARRIEEGQCVVNEYTRMHNLNMYDGAELRGSTRQCG